MTDRIKNFIKKICRNAPPEDQPGLQFTKELFSAEKYTIGEYTYGFPKVLFPHPDSTLIIGKYCSIAEGVTILLGGNHYTDAVSTYPFYAINNEYFDEAGISGTKGNVVIGNDVWVGYGCTILSGVTVSDGAVLAAGAVLTKNVGPYEIWGGNPAKFIKKRFDEEQIIQLLKIKWWDLPREKILESAPKLCSNDVNYFICKL